MKVLIVTHSHDDEGVNEVISNLKKNGVGVFRFNTDLYPTQVELSSHYTNTIEENTVSYQGISHCLSTFDAIWYRRNHIGEDLPEEMLEVHKSPAIEEAKATLNGVLASWGIDKFTLDNLKDHRYAANKQLQLKVASRLGLNIPQTLLSNSPGRVKSFIEQYTAVISKTHYSFSIIDEQDQEYRVYSQKWQPHELQDLDWLVYSPLIFQEYIEKAYELRVIIVGDQVFCGKIPSQTSEKGKVDWRKDHKLMENLECYKLPEGIQLRLLRLMDYFRLNYGAIDLIKTPEGEYIFLEINPVGEFYWIDNLYDQKIAQAIADVLVNKVWRRN
ncbi:hypothetical protein BKI52_08825 [marine bacterium AO1-C]|nr:hypothetical protein BKI52_08825 [marine bacterium AO1-C]